jgi:hypothetical protein
MVTTGKYTIIQYLDPVTTTWMPLKSVPGVPLHIASDGVNFRVFNPTGCVVGAVVTTAGSTAAYVAATTTVTPSSGNSTWVAVVGGAINTTTTVTNAGSGYTIAPNVFFPAPPAPGVPATGYTSINAGGSVTGITITNQGAGYLTAPVPVILPSPYDPNVGSVKAAVGKVTLTGTGKITAVLCTNPGAPVTSAPTLTIAGGDSTAGATAIWCQTITTTTIGSNLGYLAGSFITTTGGYPAATAVYTNPIVESPFDPRPATIIPAIGTASMTTVSKVQDSGLFLYAPTPAAVNGNGITSTAATLTVTMGNTQDIILIQPC